MTTEQKRFLKIGLLTLVSVLIVWGGFQFLNENNSYENTYDLFLKIDDARQINPTSPILFKGKKIGVIRDIELLDHSTGLMLTLAIDNGVQISKNVNVVLNASSENRQIDFLIKKNELPFYEARDTVQLVK